MEKRVDILESDIYKRDKKTVDTQKILFLIWKNRFDGNFINDAVGVLSKFMDEKRVFNEVEFYLPQWAHLIIHLDTPNNIGSVALERLAVVISQVSIHTALQLNFLLLAALEDYESEGPTGMKNPNANLNRYYRCGRILNSIERTVVFGSPVLTKFEESRLLSHLPSAKIAEMYDLEKTERVLDLVLDDLPEVPSPHDDPSCSGELLYKRIVRKNAVSTKPWKPRYFAVEQRILFCYHDKENKTPLRSILLPFCKVGVLENKHPFAFYVENTHTNNKFLLRAKDQEQFDFWVNLLNRESSRPPDAIEITPPSEVVDSSSGVSVKTMLEMNTITGSLENVLTAGQLKRYTFFLQQRSFLSAMTDICEQLRFLDRDVRKFFLRRDMNEIVIPPFSYLPLCSSLSRYHTILRALPNEGRAFTTKARCPALMLFEVEEHPKHCDVATFLSTELHEYEETEIFCSALESKPKDYTVPEGGNFPTEVASNDPDEPQFSRFTKLEDTGKTHWRPEGTGMVRIGKTSSLVMNELDESSTVSPSNAKRPAPNVRALSVFSVANATESNTHEPPRDGTFASRAAKLRESSPFGHLPGWKLDGLIAKSNDDVRQEVFVMQLISYFQMIFHEAKLPVWLHVYKILSCSKTTGLIQLIPDAISLDGLKKSKEYPGSLRAHFEKTYGGANRGVGEEPPALKAAIGEFVKSLAAYSLVSYLLAIKDRHNGNIMIDTDGHIIHIDFGFVFGLAPGKQFSMETAPFKLTEEYVEVMGGLLSDHATEFRQMFVSAFLAARRHANSLVTLVDIMTFQSNYPSFMYNEHAISDFRSRFMLDLADSDIEAEVDKMMKRSYNHTGTGLYDSFQVATNGIAK